MTGSSSDRPADSSRRRVRPRTLKEIFGPASQAEMYLLRALEEFDRASNAPDLWKPLSGLLKDSLLAGGQAVGDAKNRRLRFLRGTVLFSAVAVEAFANELLDELLAPADFEALDRLDVAAKLLIGTRLAAGESPISRSAQPLQDVALLATTRNRLMHPKPKNGIAAWIQDIEATDEAAVGPKAALTAIIRVAETMEICTTLRSHPHMHAGIAKTIVRHRQLLVAHSQLGGPKIMDVPDSGAEGVTPLWDQMQERDARRVGLRGDLRDAAVTSEPVRGSGAPELGGRAIAQDEEAGPSGGQGFQASGEPRD